MMLLMRMTVKPIIASLPKPFTVPILPDFLLKSDANKLSTDLIYNKFDLQLVPNILAAGATANGTHIQEHTVDFEMSQHQPIGHNIDNSDENVSIGVLLSVKAFVQLLVNPIVGAATKRVGYHWPILCGTLCLVLSSFVFALADNYFYLLIARAIQGVGSSCLGVCGMSLVAQLYPEDDRRSKVMGIVLGSIALGVLIGYPVGGILYDFVGKSSPFWILCVLLSACVVTQVKWLDLRWPEPANKCIDSDSGGVSKQWWELLTDLEIVLVSLAICISTSAMAILEPCLPLWLIDNLHPAGWQLGTVFIPDSLGYLIGTNCFGKIAYELGQIRVAVVALCVIGGSCIMVR